MVCDADNRKYASPEREAKAKQIFPLTMTPDDYAAQHGAEWATFPYEDYRYRDEALDEWIQKLSRVFKIRDHYNRAEQERAK